MQIIPDFEWLEFSQDNLFLQIPLKCHQHLSIADSVATKTVGCCLLHARMNADPQ